ncbi:glycoside hydrolase family 35 protein [Amylostereum chailletii]|nr:glycoside hydrolase family 35 protein [Amylostereum chailletii]
MPFVMESKTRTRGRMPRTWAAWTLLGLASFAVAVTAFSPGTLRGDLARQREQLAARSIPEERAVADEDAGPQALFSSNGRTEDVQWDEYSLLIKGQRVLIYSGEFHTFRLPVPSLWLDILQKVKAAGLNAVSVYTHWGVINPSPGVIDFDAYRALQPLYDAARAAGIFIVLRPGPYINAETTAGGIAHWVTSEVAGLLRTNATDYTAAWKDYIAGITEQTVHNQISEGGPVIAVQIDNEYSQGSSGAQGYFVNLEATYNSSGIVVPLTYNDPQEGKNFVNGTGAVEIYGLDAYPQGFDCSHPTSWRGVTTNYHDYHANTNPSQPWYFPEFQGGAFDAWGPTAPGYPNCRILTGADFEQVFYKGLWASNAKMMSFYMVYGGTSWGALPFPGVYTSYDYGSAIQESRELGGDKYTELKLQGLFLRTSPEFYKTDWVGNSSTSAVSVSNSAAFVVKLQNPDTNATFWIARQADSTSTDTIAFKLNVTTSAGTLSIPSTVSNITLSGRQSKTIVTDYNFGQSSFLRYSTAPILFAGRIGSRDVLFAYGDSNQAHEIAVGNNSDPLLSFPGGTVGGPAQVHETDGQLILFSDTPTAGSFFAPVLAGDASDSLAEYWQIGTNATVLVGGPHLVRNASLGADGTLALFGDLNQTTRLVVIGPDELKGVTWNGETVAPNATAAQEISSTGVFVGTVTYSTDGVPSAPTLSGWKFKDSLPEIQAGFDDSEWIVANHTTTNITEKPLYGDGRVLYGCDYGFCENVVLWRGHFNATGSETSANLSIIGGDAFAASVFLNDVFIGTAFGNETNNNNNIDQVDAVYNFPDGAVKVGVDNVITIVQDNMGIDEGSKSARGVRGFQLNNGTFGEWKVQGKVGGYTGFLDKTRGVMNDGGLFAQREGWHLPGFDTSSWESRDLSQGLPNATVGVGFFVTTFALDVPSGFDVLMSFNFDDSTQPYRALLFVNGWMMGKRVANLGPQVKFPVHEGILDYSGTNTIAVALWAMSPTAITPSLDVAIDTVLTGGVGGVTTNNPSFSDVVGQK